MRDQFEQRRFEFFLAAEITSISWRSVEKLLRCNCGPLESAPRMSKCKQRSRWGREPMCSASEMDTTHARAAEHTGALADGTGGAGFAAPISRWARHLPCARLAADVLEGDQS